MACHAARERKKRACERHTATIKAEGQEGDHEVVDEAFLRGNAFNVEPREDDILPYR